MAGEIQIRSNVVACDRVGDSNAGGRDRTGDSICRCDCA